MLVCYFPGYFYGYFSKAIVMFVLSGGRRLLGYPAIVVSGRGTASLQIDVKRTSGVLQPSARDGLGENRSK